MLAVTRLPAVPTVLLSLLEMEMPIWATVVTTSALSLYRFDDEL